MFYSKRCLCVVLTLLWGVALHAQQAQNVVTLQQLLNSVNQKAPTLLTDSAAILIKRAQAVETKNNILPNLNLNYQADIGTSNSINGPYFGFGIVPSSSGGIHSNNNTSAETVNLGIAAFDWEIYNFGKYGAQNRVANSDIAVQQNNYANSKYQLQAYTISNYLQLLRLQDFIGIQAQNIARSLQILTSIRSLAISGVRPGVDTSFAQAELSKARLNYIELVNQLKQVQLQLSAISGLPYQTIIPDSAAQMKLIGLITGVPYSGVDTSNHPVINYYRSLYQNSLVREDLVKKQYNPKILFEADAWERGGSVNSSDQYTSLSNGFNPQRDNYLIGVGISYNLFDLRRKQLKLRTQKTETYYARKKLEEQKALLAISANQADVELSTAIDRLKEIPNQLKAATAGFNQKLSLYRSGLTDIIELNAALDILYRAENDYIQAKYLYSSALFQKAVAENQVGSVLNLLK